MLDYHENGYETNYHFNPDLQHAGISCPVCHVRNHIRYGPPPTSKPAAKQWTGPGHGGAYTTSAFEDSDFCAKCHQFDPEGFALNGKLLQNTHTEWEQSPQAAEGETCQTCHMPDRRHLWRGIHHLPTVQEAVHIDVLPVSHTDSLIVQIRLYNTGAGHHLPTYVTPKLFVQAQMLDKNAQIIKKATRVVGREIILTSQESREVFDTRIPAGGIWTWRYALAPTPTATHLAIDVEVHPDHFYLHFFQTYSRMGLSPEAVSLIDSAEARARHSTYSLVRHQWFIVDLFKN